MEQDEEQNHASFINDEESDEEESKYPDERIPPASPLAPPVLRRQANVASSGSPARPPNPVQGRPPAAAMAAPNPVPDVDVEFQRQGGLANPIQVAGLLFPPPCQVSRCFDYDAWLEEHPQTYHIPIRLDVDCSQCVIVTHPNPLAQMICGFLCERFSDWMDGECSDTDSDDEGCMTLGKRKLNSLNVMDCKFL